MGNHDDLHHHYHEEKLEENTVPIINLGRLRVLSPLGRGAKGVVFLVMDEECGEFCALKVISRDLVEKKGREMSDGKEYKRVRLEQQVLSGFKHPLLPRLRGVLSTDKIVGYAIDYCPGRDLNWLRKQQTEKMFAGDIIRFYAAELVLALEYLHNLGIAYRDLKPENIMIQENGHIMLVDFDLSTILPPKSSQSSPNSSPVSVPKGTRKKRSFPFLQFCNSGISPYDSSELAVYPRSPESDWCEKSNSFVGTEEYVAPEIIQGYGHDFAVDWWSLGVVLYEMLYGITPFKGNNRKETFFRILTKSPELVGEATPLRDLIRKMLVKDPKQRITLEGIKGHDFFKGIDWNSILNISRPPYIPAIETANVHEEEIEVETFVEGMFGGGEDEKSKAGDKSQVHGDEAVGNKGVWVKGLNSYPCETDNFNVF